MNISETLVLNHICIAILGRRYVKLKQYEKLVITSIKEVEPYFPFEHDFLVYSATLIVALRSTFQKRQKLLDKAYDLLCNMVLERQKLIEPEVFGFFYKSENENKTISSK